MIARHNDRVTPVSSAVADETRDFNPLNLPLPNLRRTRSPLVVIRAAQVVAAFRAYQLAVVADQPMRAVGANLAVMINWRTIHCACAHRTGMRDFSVQSSIESARQVRQHAGQISIEGWAACHKDENWRHPRRRPMHQFWWPRQVVPKAARQ
jgi:hypothetical protein